MLQIPFDSHYCLKLTLLHEQKTFDTKEGCLNRLTFACCLVACRNLMELGILGCFVSANWFQNDSIWYKYGADSKGFKHHRKVTQNTLSIVWEVSSLKEWASICKERQYSFNILIAYNKSQHRTHKLVKNALVLCWLLVLHLECESPGELRPCYLQKNC